MTAKEHKKYIASMKRYANKILASPAESKKLLVKAGIYTDKGNLKKPYR